MNHDLNKRYFLTELGMQSLAATGTPLWQRVAALAVAAGADEKRLIESVGWHPLVSAAELGALLNESEALIERRLAWLARCDAVCTVSATSPGNTNDEGNHRMNHNLNKRYVLTELGMRSLAARAGVPPDTFARHGGVTSVDSTRSDGPARAIRHREHTIGVNRFFAHLAADARHAGWRLDEWRNEAESTRRFVDADSRASWIRPDGSGVLVRGVESRPFLLEYDRGTLDASDYRAKFEGYRRYFAQREWEGDFASEPALLFVCSDDRAEERVWRATLEAGTDVALRSTTEWRFEHKPRSAPTGLHGRIWRSRGADGGGREPWVLVESEAATREGLR